MTIELPGGGEEDGGEEKDMMSKIQGCGECGGAHRDDVVCMHCGFTILAVPDWAVPALMIQ